MIRARGWISEPTTLVIQRSGDDILLSWSSTGAPYYRVFQSSDSEGPFATPIASVSDTTYLDNDAVLNSEIFFYQIKSSASP